MAGIDREGRDDRNDRPVEVGIEVPPLLRRELGRAQQSDALGGEQRLELVEEAPVLLVAEPARALRDSGQGLGRGEAVEPRARVVLAHAALEPGHAHHEELVEVRADDRKELDPLEQRYGRILGLFEDPAIELEPRQLAVDERVAVHALDAPRKVSSSRSPCRTPSSHTVRAS